METSDELYSYFLQALRYSIEKKGHGAQKILSIDSGVSRSMLSQILSDNSPKNASMKTQVDIAKACGYSFEDFLEVGRKISNGELEIPHGKSSGINQNSNIDAKVGSGMDANEKDAILRHCLEELAALREEIKYLREERNELRDRLKQEKEKQVPVSEPEEKKTAV